MPNIQRRPDEPLTVELEQILRPAPAELWQPLLNAPGSFTACDLWFQMPAEQRDNAFRLFGLNGSIKVPLQGIRSINDAKAVWKANGGNVWSGLLYSVRNRPCDGFLIEMAPAGIASTVQSKFRLECWWDCGSVYSDDAGWIQVDPWGINGDPASYKLYTYRSPPTGVPTGTTLLAPDPGIGNRYDLIYLNATTNDPNPSPITLQNTSTDPPFTFNALNFVVDNQSAPYVYDGPGLRGAIGANWEIVATAPPPPARLHVIAQFRRSPAYPA